MTEFVWPERDQSKGAWFGSEELKAWAVARMLEHRAADEIVQGVYQEFAEGGTGYRGCLIGCTLPRDTCSMAPFGPAPMGPGRGYVLPSGEFVPGGIAREWDVENLYGIRWEVADLLEHTFETTDFDEAADFAVASIEAIPVGMKYPDPCGVDGAFMPQGTEAVLEFLRTGVAL